VPQHPVGHRPDDVSALGLGHRQLPSAGRLGRHHADARQPLTAHLDEHGRGRGIGPGCRLHHQLERRDALGGLGREGGVQHQPLGEVRLVADGEDVGTLVEDDVLLVASDGDVPGAVQQRRLVPEGGIDGLDRHARALRDVGNGRVPVPPLDEKVAGRADDQGARLLSLLPAA
jgi:hypothetical protein